MLPLPPPTPALLPTNTHICQSKPQFHVSFLKGLIEEEEHGSDQVYQY